MHDVVSDLSDSLSRTSIRNYNLDDTISRIISKNEERHIQIEALELDLVRYKDYVIKLKKDNRVVLKQKKHLLSYWETSLY